MSSICSTIFYSIFRRLENVVEILSASIVAQGFIPVYSNIYVEVISLPTFDIFNSCFSITVNCEIGLKNIDMRVFFLFCQKWRQSWRFLIWNRRTVENASIDSTCNKMTFTFHSIWGIYYYGLKGNLVSLK